MPIQINWADDAKTVIRLEFIRRWTWEETYECSQAGYTLCDSQDHIVNVIIDMRQSAGLPLRSLTHARNLIARRHPRTGLTAFIGANQLFVTLWKALSNMYKQDSLSESFTFARDDAEAFELFAARRNNSNPINKAESS